MVRPSLLFFGVKPARPGGGVSRENWVKRKNGSLSPRGVWARERGRRRQPLYPLPRSAPRPFAELRALKRAKHASLIPLSPRKRERRGSLRVLIRLDGRAGADQ